MQEKKVQTKVKNKLDITLGISLAVAFVLVLSILVSSGAAPIITGMAGKGSGLKFCSRTVKERLNAPTSALALEWFDDDGQKTCSVEPFSYVDKNGTPDDQDDDTTYFGVKAVFYW